jgi:hypothetical protein
MARDKLITIRIEGEKRQAFGDLAKSQNTDTASLLYDFISQCLDSRIDISLVTGKGNRLDKIDNQIGSDRIDKLEMTTQRIDNRLDTIAKKLTDWVIAFDDRLNDCDQGLSEKMVSLEHRLKTLSIQLDIQQDRQGETPDMGTVATVETVYTVEAAIEKVEAVTDTVETAIDKVESDSSIEPDKGAIGPVPDDSSHLKNQLSEAVTISNRQGLTNQQLSEKTRVPVSTIEKWKGKMKIGEPIVSKRYPDFFKQWRLNPTDSLWYEVD